MANSGVAQTDLNNDLGSAPNGLGLPFATAPVIGPAGQGIANQVGGSGTVTADQAGATGAVAGANDPISNLPLQSALYQNAQGAQANGQFETNWPRNGQLVHGYMKTAAATGNPSIPKEFFVYFLFNPLEIDNAYNFDSSVLPTAFQAQAIAQSQAAIMQNQAITFTLPFDRTYEVSNFMQGPVAKGGQTPPDPAKNPAVGPGSLGVMWDIRAIERLTGIYDGTNPPSGPMGGGTGNVQPSSPSGPAQAAPIDVFFGKALYFRGYFSQLEIDVQRFSHTMVPVHCEVTITLSRIWLDPKQLDLSHGPREITGGSALIAPRLGAGGAPVIIPGNANLVPGITSRDTTTAVPADPHGNAAGNAGGPAPSNPEGP